MIYLYSRALGSQEPFAIAKENLTRLLKKFGGSFGILIGILEGNLDRASSEAVEKMSSNYPGEEHLLYASYLAVSKYNNLPTVKVSDLSPQIAILNGNLTNIETETDSNFLSSLIGSSFIGEQVQAEILKVFNSPSETSYESVQLPMSQ